MRIFVGSEIMEVSSAKMSQNVEYTKKFFKEKLNYTGEYTVTFRLMGGVDTYIYPRYVSKEVANEMLKTLFETGMLDLTEYGELYSNPLNITRG